MAIKFIDKRNFSSENELEMFTNEVQILAALTNPHIVKLHETFETADHYVLVMDRYLFLAKELVY